MKKTGFTARSANPATPATVLLVSLLLSVSASADQIVERKMTIAIDDGSDNEVLINLDDGGSAVAMHDMQLGETRSLVDAQGRTVLITRTEDGLELNVDGKIIDVPAFDAGPHRTMTATLVRDDVEDVDIDIDVSQAVHVDTLVTDHDGGIGDGVTIISGNTIDDATKDSIRSILSSSGHTGEVVFIDGEIHGGDADQAHAVHEARRIKIISREVSATN